MSWWLVILGLIAVLVLGIGLLVLMERERNIGRDATARSLSRWLDGDPL